MKERERYRLVTSGVDVPVPGGKTIVELFGRASTGTDTFSLARMVAPPGWAEPSQTPEFGELTVVLRGRIRVEAEGEELTVAAGQAFWSEAGVRVRFGNPFDEESEYYAVCIPAFTPQRARREEA